MGEMGVVYKARDTRLKRFVALKFLTPTLTTDENSKQRFMIEAQAASALDHPNICTIYEINLTPDGQMYICMAYYDGETLKLKVDDRRLTFEEAIGITVQIAHGLAKAHGQGIIHRDIKPANVIITNDGVVKILDFGLAKLAWQDITQSIRTLGTVAYMSPEQIQKLETDHRTDIWSLGVVLYEMLAGQRPFQGDSELPLMYSIVNESPPPLAEYNANIPARCQQIIDKALEKNPAKRYQEADNLAADLFGVKTTIAPSSSYQRALSKPSRKTTKFRKITLLTTGLVILAIIAGIVVYSQLLDTSVPAINASGNTIFTAAEWEKIQPSREREFVIAIAPLQKAIRLDPTSSDLYFSLGYTYLRYKKFTRAVETFKKAIELDPQFDWAYIGLGLTYRDMRRYEEAIDVFGKVIDLKPHNADAYRFRGSVFFRQDDYESAAEQILKSIQLAPESPFGYADLALVHRWQGILEKAESNYLKAIELDSNWE